MRRARVDDARDPGGPRGVDDVAVLLDALPHLGAGDEHEDVHPGERRGERLGPCVVGLADLDAAVSKVRDLVGRARERDDLGRVGPAGEEGLDDEAAEVAAGSGDGDGHARAPSSAGCAAGRPHDHQHALTFRKCIPVESAFYLTALSARARRILGR
ncbi:Uncharacterised protein [Mycobacteroides abscessus]|nr:Uncharacterised protein [Mycobacteroides abscessus]